MLCYVKSKNAFSLETWAKNNAIPRHEHAARSPESSPETPRKPESSPEAATSTESSPEAARKPESRPEAAREPRSQPRRGQEPRIQLQDPPGTPNPAAASKPKIPTITLCYAMLCKIIKPLSRSRRRLKTTPFRDTSTPPRAQNLA